MSSAPTSARDVRARRWRTVLAVGLSVAFFGTLLSFAPTATAAPADPTTDSYEMPAGCAGPSRSIKQPAGGCKMTPFVRSRPTVVIWGDSHAYQQMPALLIAAREHKVNLVAFVMGGCPPVKVTLKPKGGRYPGLCEHSNAQAFRYVSKLERQDRPVKLILGSNWAGFRALYQTVYVEKDQSREYKPFLRRMLRLAHRGTDRLFPALGKAGVSTDIIGQTATVPDDAECPAGRTPFVCELPRTESVFEEAKTSRWLLGLMRRLPGKSRLIDVNSGTFCNQVICLGRGGNGTGIHTWYNDLHLSVTRVRTMAFKYDTSMRSVR